ncbi:MAG: cation diffusion facilitator family transporter [Pseudomonadota bacterium]
MIALVITSGFMVVEVIGGVLSGSLALLADAGHMLTDSMALALAALAFHVSNRPADQRRTFGYQRSQVIAAFANGLTLLFVVGWIIVEATMRLFDPPEVAGPLMLGVAFAGLLVNIASFAVLHGGDQDNLNIRGAALHVAGDLLGSVAAIVAAVVIIYTGWLTIDPLLSFAVAALILKSAWTLIRKSANVLLEGAPEWLDEDAMRQRLVSSIPEVQDIHAVHVWGLTPQHLILTMHIQLANPGADLTGTVRRAKELLHAEYGIGHSTIEVEFDRCSDGRC